MSVSALASRPSIVSQELLVVRGGRPLAGSVPIGGFKHALTVVVAAAVATARAVTLRNVPITTETLVLERILRRMGAESRLEDGVWELDTRPMRSVAIPQELSRLVHGSLYLAPALLGRFGSVRLPVTGGDQIGPPELGGRRPDAQITAVMERFGASVDASGSRGVRAGRLAACTIDILAFSSHPHRLRGPAASSATKTALLLAAASEGRTTLLHPVQHEATEELCDFLGACGVTITREDDAWHVEGGGHHLPVVHHLISDSAEIMTFIAAAVFVGGSLRLTGITGQRTWRTMGHELRLLRWAGVPLTLGPNWLEVGATASIRPLDLELECNWNNVDAHPLLALMLLRATGESRITDHVWTSRFAYARLLAEMGARLHVSGPTVRIQPGRLHPPALVLQATDSRAAAAALLAALGTAGETRIHSGDHLARSYENLAAKLRSVGAQLDGVSGRS